MHYLGDFKEDSTVYVIFNTNDGDGASTTITNLATTDIHIHKDGSVTQKTADDGITLSINFDSVTGNHLIAIDTSDDTNDVGFWVAGADYQVRIEGVTVNGQTINVWIGSFSIENRYTAASPGDNEVTLTIRETDTTPLPGVEVWLNTVDDRSETIITPKTTGDGGVVTFNLNYGVKYYIFCHLAGYSFTSADMTPESGSVTFTKDIATALSGSAAGYTNSFLTRAITDFRSYIDEPSVNAKYTDAVVIERIEKAYAQVIGEVNRNKSEPAVAKFTITQSDTATEYLLPPLIGSVYAIYSETETGTKLFYSARSRYSPLGRGIWIEGNTLKLQSTTVFPSLEPITVEYIPSGTARLHNGTCTVDSTGLIITLGASPNQGVLDTHKDAYVGSILRIIDDSDSDYDYIQERLILAYDRTTREATLQIALSPNQGDGVHSGTTYYEIAPPIHQGLDNIMALKLASQVAASESTVTRARLLEREYTKEIRNIRLTAYYSNIQEAGHVGADTFDNRRYRRL